MCLIVAPFGPTTRPTKNDNKFYNLRNKQFENYGVFTHQLDMELEQESWPVQELLAVLAAFLLIHPTMMAFSMHELDWSVQQLIKFHVLLWQHLPYVQSQQRLAPRRVLVSLCKCLSLHGVLWFCILEIEIRNDLWWVILELWLKFIRILRLCPVFWGYVSSFEVISVENQFLKTKFH